jgi:hypothetical protein
MWRLCNSARLQQPRTPSYYNAQFHRDVADILASDPQTDCYVKLPAKVLPSLARWSSPSGSPSSTPLEGRCQWRADMPSNAQDHRRVKTVRSHPHGDVIPRVNHAVRAR